MNGPSNHELAQQIAVKTQQANHETALERIGHQITEQMSDLKIEAGRRETRQVMVIIATIGVMGTLIGLIAA